MDPEAIAAIESMSDIVAMPDIEVALAIEAVPPDEGMTAFDEALVQICLEELMAADGSQARIERQIAGMTQSLAFIIAVAAAGNQETAKNLLNEAEASLRAKALSGLPEDMIRHLRRQTGAVQTEGDH